NNSGVIVGQTTRTVEDPISGFSETDFRAIRWNADGSPVELQSLEIDSIGGANSGPIDINDAGIAAGYSRRTPPGQNINSRPVRWDPSGNVTELATPLVGSWRSGQAEAINSAGVIVGKWHRATTSTDL